MHIKFAHKKLWRRYFIIINLLSSQNYPAPFIVQARRGSMPSRTSQQASISGPMRGNTTVHYNNTNPHCCACNNAIIPSVNNTNNAYITNYRQGAMYHGNPNLPNHNSHIQQNPDVYHKAAASRVMVNNSHSHRHHHHNNPHNYGASQDQQRMTKASINDATQYYICECTSCRNLGNSVDICCQCCNCGNMTSNMAQEDTEEQEMVHANYTPSRGYHVSSVALTGDTEDTLEVVFDDDSGEGVIEEHNHHRQHPNSQKINETCNNVEGPHHHVHTYEEMSDDIAYAHNLAESSHNHQGRQSQKHLGCVSCNSCSCSGKPVFHGWGSHHINHNMQHSNPQQQQQQQRHQQQKNVYQNKRNIVYHHHHHHNPQGGIQPTNNQHCTMIASSQQHSMQMNSRGLSNHQSPHSDNNQERSENTHHSKQPNKRNHKPTHLCCSQGNNKPCRWPSVSCSVSIKRSFFNFHKQFESRQNIYLILFMISIVLEL